MKYILDTCCVSDFVKGDKNTLSHIKNCSPTDLSISSITAFEIEYGLLINAAAAKKLKKPIHDFLSVISIIPYTEKDALISAKIRAKLKKQGNPIGSYDVLIASTALQNKLILITSNVNEFSRIDNLKIQNWRQ
jgi:tRNA(fMet)-specific endonuclease VapC